MRVKERVAQRDAFINKISSSPLKLITNILDGVHLCARVNMSSTWKHTDKKIYQMKRWRKRKTNFAGNSNFRPAGEENRIFDVVYKRESSLPQSIDHLKFLRLLPVLRWNLGKRWKKENLLHARWMGGQGERKDFSLYEISRERNVHRIFVDIRLTRAGSWLFSLRLGCVGA